MWTKRDHNLGRRGAAVLLLLVALLAACGAANQTAETVEVFVGDLSANATASGTLRAGRAATLESSAMARVSDVRVRAGQQVAAGEPLVVLDATDLELNVRAAQGNLRQAEAQLADLLGEPTPAEMAAAEAAVASAQAQLDDLLAGPSAAELAALESSLRSAEAGVASANAELTNADSSVSAADLSAAEAQLAAAQLQLRAAEDANEELTDAATHAALQTAQQAVAAAQARVDDLRRGPDTGAAQGSAAAAAARLQSARAEYERQTAGPTAAQRAQAESQLADAQASLAQLEAGPTAAQRASAEAAVEQARLALADAEEALAKATITAPFDGAVTTVYVQPGEIAAGPVVALVDPRLGGGHGLLGGLQRRVAGLVGQLLVGVFGGAQLQLGGGQLGLGGPQVRGADAALDVGHFGVGRSDGRLGAAQTRLQLGQLGRRRPGQQVVQLGLGALDAGLSRGQFSRRRLTDQVGQLDFGLPQVALGGADVQLQVGRVEDDQRGAGGNLGPGAHRHVADAGRGAALQRGSAGGAQRAAGRGVGRQIADEHFDRLGRLGGRAWGRATGGQQGNKHQQERHGCAAPPDVRIAIVPHSVIYLVRWCAYRILRGEFAEVVQERCSWQLLVVSYQ